MTISFRTRRKANDSYIWEVVDNATGRVAATYAGRLAADTAAARMTRQSIDRQIEIQNSERCRKMVARLNELTDIKWTFGYIGNCDQHIDDRQWFAFAAHPGRVGTADDSIGGYSTERLGELAGVLAGAVSLARVLHARTSRGGVR